MSDQWKFHSSPGYEDNKLPMTDMISQFFNLKNNLKGGKSAREDKKPLDSTSSASSPREKPKAKRTWINESLSYFWYSVEKFYNLMILVL